MTGGTPGRFHVPLRPDLMAQLQAFAAREVAAGRAAEVKAVLGELDYRLRFEADEWGESRDYFPGLELDRRFGTVGRVSVWYTVHAGQAKVFVHELRFRDRPPGG